MEIYDLIQSLLDQSMECEMIEREDEIYARNQLMSLLQLADYPEKMEGVKGASIPDVLEQIVQYAFEKGIVGILDADKEIFSSKLMNVLVQRPSDVNRRFYRHYEKDPTSATEYFYQLSQNSNYIQTKSIAKNISYKTDTPYGELDITINLSKPEKDPKQIALEKEKKQDVQYPKCLLCEENEGYVGRVGHPARSNHRMIRLELEDEPWYLQYSPYVYYNEHCIVLSKEHRDMKISRKGFERLLSFVEKFPHYFVGSNADLPIVGGSILTHDHYQGGNYEFAMARADEEYSFRMKEFSHVSAATVKWPMSVIRLRSRNKEELIQAADYILTNWKGYSDEKVDIYAYSGDTPHNTITPIARMREGQFELDLVLRNNRTSEKHPLGIFHPHSDVHHIKKENIGLIEVMGLAVLPARLKEELEEVKVYLLGRSDLVKDYHLTWAEELMNKYETEWSDDTAEEILRREVGLKFQRVLEDAGVFKRDTEGQVAFRRFCESL
ncbi:UDP-glucose--hexose-1-phosphate uridylyltransferase [Bacillus sp. Y1]|nr:UDP-glucose--hexose-1-phosphate uridylyltransferase [Bacillus sp. Y1]AYA74686.1 UDP-glucose--hexose-1-phosphate uridylyltransferase [Bacillus sp. Y1]